MSNTKKWDFSKQCGSGKTRQRLKPLSTLEEVAEKLGVLLGQLRYAMRAAPAPAPEPQLITANKRWYRFDAMKAWWDAIDGKTIAVSEKAEYHRRWREKQKASQSSMTGAA